MIVSASRRTDIPAFYGEWFMNRIREGFVCVRSPFRADAVSRVSLRPEDAEAIAFWSKNPAPFLPYLDELDAGGYRYYFQFALNAYGPELELYVPPQAQLLETFRRLSGRIGSARTQWRYSPVVFTRERGASWHLEHFGRLARALSGSTRVCIVSFLDEYPKLGARLAQAGAFRPAPEAVRELLAAFRDIAAANGMALQTCTDGPETEGVSRLGCINNRILSEVLGAPVALPKDRGQRPACACVASVDIGAYHSCRNGCIYCYANAGQASVARSCGRHNPASPLLIGELTPDLRVTERRNVPLARSCQHSLFDEN